MRTAMARRPSSDEMGPNLERLGGGAGAGAGPRWTVSGAGDGSGVLTPIGLGAATRLRAVASLPSDMSPLVALVARCHRQLPPGGLFVTDRINLRSPLASDNASEGLPECAAHRSSPGQTARP